MPIDKYFEIYVLRNVFLLQAGRSSLAEHGGAYFSAISGSIKDPIATPGPYENQEV